MVVPAWLIILEKLSVHAIKKLLTEKITMVQFGFVERGNCNIAKIMMWYQLKQNWFSKHLLIDIKKAFDSIGQNQLRNFLNEDFQSEQLSVLLHFIDI